MRCLHPGCIRERDIPARKGPPPQYCAEHRKQRHVIWRHRYRDTKKAA